MSVEILRPNAPGDECNISAEVGCSECPDHYDCVDEASQDGDSTRVESGAASYSRDLYNIADHSEGGGTINHIKVFAVARASTYEPTQASLKIAMKSTAAHEGDEETLELDVYNTYSKQWDTNPDNGHAWTWDEIDALQIGVAIRKPAGWGSGTRVTQVYVEVDYTSGVTEKESSDSGSGVDALYSLEKGEVKTSSDTGSGVEGTPMQSAILVGNETGSGIEALVARLLAAFDTGTGTEVGGLLKNLFASELGWGSDSLIAKIETPTKGGGMKLWN